MEQKAVQLFNRGMSRDKSISKSDVEFAFENHNIRITARDHDTLLSVTNERGNKVIKGLHYNGYLIGWNVLNNYIILFTCEPSTATPDHIYRLHYTNGEFNSICVYSGNLNFSTKNPIESIVDYENDTIQKIYWLDGRNVLRFLNFSDEFLTKHLVSPSTLENPVFDFVSDSFDSTRGTSTTPTVSITKSNDGNRRQNGVMQYFITYYNKNGIQTGIIYSSPLVYLAPPTGSNSVEEFNYSQVVIEMDNLDTTFDYVRVYAVLRTSLDVTNSAFIIGESTINSGKAKIIDSGNTLTPVDITSLLYLGSKRLIASTLVQKDSTLFLGDLTSIGNQSVDAIEAAIKSSAFTGGQFVENTSWESAIVSFEYSDNDSDYKDIPYVESSGLYPFSTQLNYLSSEISTFKGGEKYRFGVRFFRSNGESSKAFWIGDKVNPLYPKITESATVQRAIAVCELPASIVNAARNADFVSVQLLIAEAMYSDRSVKAQGIVNPTVFNLLDRYKDAPYAQSSWMYRMFGGKYAYNHFETLHRSDTVSAELQNSWWDESKSAPAPLYIVDSDGDIINTPYAETEYNKLIVYCKVYCQSFPRKYWGDLIITKIVVDNETEISTVFTYGIGGRGIGSAAKPALIEDWLRAYEECNIPVTQRAKTEEMDKVCDDAYDNMPDIWTPGEAEYRLPEGSGSVPINYNTSDQNNTFSTNSREYFFVDSNIVTLNSPEIEYEAVNIDRYSSLKFRIVGVARVTGNISDYEISADDFEYPGSRVLDFNLSVPNISNYLKAITARPIYLEYGKVVTGTDGNEEETISPSPYSFMMYLWHKAGSIPEFTFNEKKISVLKRKLFANMYFSYYSVYNNYNENVWSVSPSDIRQFNALSEQLYEIGVNSGKRIYAANIDKMVTMPMDAKYPTFYSTDIGYDAELLSLSKYEEGTEAPIQMTYNSKPHAVITLPVDSGVDTILPYMFASGKYEPIKVDNIESFGPYIPWGPKNNADAYLYRECTSSEDSTLFTVGSYNNLYVVGSVDDTNNKISLYKNLSGAITGTGYEAFSNLVRNAHTVDADTPVYMMAYFNQSAGSESPLSPLLVDVSDAELTDIDFTAEWVTQRGTDTDRLNLVFKSTGARISSVSYTAVGVKVSEEIGFGFTDSMTKPESDALVYKFSKEFERNLNVYRIKIEFHINFYGSILPQLTVVFDSDTFLDKAPLVYIPSVQKDKTYPVAFVVNDANYLNQRTAESPIELVNLFDQRLTTVNSSTYTVGNKNFGLPYQNPTQLKYELESPFITEDSQYVYIGELYEDFDALVSEDPTADTRYGGISEDAIESNTFIPTGSKVTISADTNAVLVGNEGDTFFQRWDSIKAYPRSSEDLNQTISGLSAMLETHINIEGRNDIDRGATHLTDISIENFGSINPVFSQKNNFSKSYDTDESLNLDTYRNAITWTMQKASNADTDEWTHITLADFLALDGDNGKLNALRRFKNSIIAFQEKGIAEILFNSRVQIQTTDGVPVEIANSGKVDGKRYITTQYGTTNKWSIIEGRTGLFFIDNRNKIIGLFNGNGIENISVKSQLDAWVRSHNSTEPWNPEDDSNTVAFYDGIHSDVYFINSSNPSQPCLVYSEILGGFVGFYDYSNVPMMTNVADRFISYHSVPRFNYSSIWLQNEGLYCDIFGVKRDFWVTWRVAPDNHTDKIWTNLEYRADFTRVLNSYGESIVDEQDLISGDTESVISNKTFDAFEVWNEYQTTGEQAILKRTYSSLPDMYPDSNKSFRIWRMDIPRATPDVTRGNKFGLDRIRNPWVYVKLKKNSGNFDQDIMQLHDVIVKYFGDK